MRQGAVDIVQFAVRRITIHSGSIPPGGGFRYGPRRGTARSRRRYPGLRGGGRSPERSTSSSSSRSCSPATRWAIRAAPAVRVPLPGRRGSGGAVPSVYVIQGYSGQVDMWLGARRVRADDRSSASTRCSPPANAPTRSSCSSTRGPRSVARSSSTRRGTGRYMDYLCDEVVPFVEERYPDARPDATIAA